LLDDCRLYWVTGIIEVIEYPRSTVFPETEEETKLFYQLLLARAYAMKLSINNDQLGPIVRIPFILDSLSAILIPGSEAMPTTANAYLPARISECGLRLLMSKQSGVCGSGRRTLPCAP
jgi:hypothetical protein